jgi:hypothetical protein
MENGLFSIDGDGSSQGALDAKDEFDKSVVSLSGFEDASWPVSFSSTTQGRSAASTFISTRQKGKAPDVACVVTVNYHQQKLCVRCLSGHYRSHDPCRAAVAERWNSENPGNQVVLERRPAEGYRVAASVADENENADSGWPMDVPGTSTSDMIRVTAWQDRDSQGENNLPLCLPTMISSETVISIEKGHFFFFFFFTRPKLRDTTATYLPTSDYFRTESRRKE